MAAKTAWRVNGRLIRAADIRAEVASMRVGAELSVEDRLALREQALERLIEREILRSAAQRMGFLPAETEADDIVQRLAVDKLMDATLAKVKRPQG